MESRLAVPGGFQPVLFFFPELFDFYPPFCPTNHTTDSSNDIKQFMLLCSLYTWVVYCGWLTELSHYSDWIPIQKSKKLAKKGQNGYSRSITWQNSSSCLDKKFKQSGKKYAQKIKACKAIKAG